MLDRPPSSAGPWQRYQVALLDLTGKAPPLGKSNSYLSDGSCQIQAASYGSSFNNPSTSTYLFQSLRVRKNKQRRHAVCTPLRCHLTIDFGFGASALTRPFPIYLRLELRLKT